MADGKVTIETDLDRSGAEKGVNRLGSSLKSGLGKLFPNWLNIQAMMK